MIVTAFRKPNKQLVAQMINRNPFTIRVPLSKIPPTTFAEIERRFGKFDTFISPSNTAVRVYCFPTAQALNAFKERFV